MAFIMIDSPLV